MEYRSQLYSFPSLIHFSYLLDEAFKDQWLVGIEFNQPHVANKSWTEIRSMPKSEVNVVFKNAKIVMCKRNVNGQVYAANGFRDMVHFTLGNEGKQRLCNFLVNNSIRYYELRGYESEKATPIWFHATSLSPKSVDNKNTFLNGMKNRIEGLAKIFIPHLMKVSRN